MLQRLPIALGQVKAGNTSESLLIYIYNEFSKGILQKWILYLWILKIIKHLKHQIFKEY